MNYLNNKIRKGLMERVSNGSSVRNGIGNRDHGHMCERLLNKYIK